MGKRPPYARYRGISYPEVLAAVVLLAVLLVPAMQALNSALHGSAVNHQQLVDQYALQSRMEEVLARPLSELQAAADAAGSDSTPTSFSDTYTTPDGRSLARRVFIAAHDADNADGDDDPRTGTDPNILWVKADIEGSAVFLETLVAP